MTYLLMDGTPGGEIAFPTQGDERNETYNYKFTLKKTKQKIIIPENRIVYLLSDDCNR
jgi:hypothetical protein